MTLSDARVTVVGSANVDFIMRLPHLPSRGETVSSGEFRQVFGGKGADRAVAAARSAKGNGMVTFVARLGADVYADTMIENFRRDGMVVEHVNVDADTPSGTALVMIGADGDNYLSVAPGSNARMTPEHVDAATSDITASNVLLTQMEVPAAAVDRAIDLASSAGVRVVLNYAPATEEAVAVDSRIDTLIVNETEARQLFGRDEPPESLAVALRDLGPAVVIITLGGQGVLVCDGGDCFVKQAFKVEPVDATAAGDTFCGAYSTALSEGKSVEDAVRFGQAAAALCVTKLGAQPSIPQRDDIERLVGTG